MLLTQAWAPKYIKTQQHNTHIAYYQIITTNIGQQAQESPPKVKTSYYICISMTHNS